MNPEDKISLFFSGVQAFTTIVLAIITYQQMKLAKKSIDSMERSIRAVFLPVLQLGIAEYSSNHKTLNIVLTNCGKGIAIRPRIKFPGQADIISNSIDVNGSDHITIEYSIDYLLEKVNKEERRIVIEYHDVFNRKIITEACLIEVNRFGPAKDQRGISWNTWTPITP